MALNNGTGSVKAYLANITKIKGVEELTTSKGVNIVDIAESFSTQLDKFNNILSDLFQRITKVEKTVSQSHEETPKSSVDIEKLNKQVQELKDRLKVFEDKLEGDDLRGRTGPQGPKGAQGPQGPKCKSLADIEDVCLDGIEDGAILVRRGDKFKFEVPE